MCNECLNNVEYASALHGHDLRTISKITKGESFLPAWQMRQYILGPVLTCLHHKKANHKIEKAQREMRRWRNTEKLQRPRTSDSKGDATGLILLTRYSLDSDHHHKWEIFGLILLSVPPQTILHESNDRIMILSPYDTERVVVRHPSPSSRIEVLPKAFLVVGW